MKAKICALLLILPLALVLGGCGQKTSTNVSQPSDNQPATEAPKAEAPATEPAAANQEENFNSTVWNMTRGGKSLQCVFSFADDASGTKENGTFFVDGRSGRFYSEGKVMITAPQAMAMTAYSIGDSQYVYSWNSATPGTGFKMSLDRAAEGDNEGAGQQTEDLNRQIDFQCQPWTVDDSKFVPPAGVQFTDFDQMIQNIPSSANPAGGNLCSACDQIPDNNLKSQCQKVNCQ